MTSGMTCNPGDIVGLPFPFSDLASRKKRPVLVLTQADYQGDFMGLAITSVLTEDNAVSIPHSLCTPQKMEQPITPTPHSPLPTPHYPLIKEQSSWK